MYSWGGYEYFESGSLTLYLTLEGGSFYTMLMKSRGATRFGLEKNGWVTYFVTEKMGEGEGHLLCSKNFSNIV